MSVLKKTTKSITDSSGTLQLSRFLGPIVPRLGATLGISEEPELKRCFIDMCLPITAKSKDEYPGRID